MRRTCLPASCERFDYVAQAQDQFGLSVGDILILKDVGEGDRHARAEHFEQLGIDFQDLFLALDTNKEASPLCSAVFSDVAKPLEEMFKNILQVQFVFLRPLMLATIRCAGEVLQLVSQSDSSACTSELDPARFSLHQSQIFGVDQRLSPRTAAGSRVTYL
jgi:hypothetical protein